MSVVSAKHPPASLYVGDLLPSVTEANLYDFFTKAGVTVASIRICRYSNDDLRRSSGYAYVNFLDANDAELALDTLNHERILGKSCRIMWQLRDPSIRKSGVGNIFIKNLDPSIGPKELSDAFSPYGDILSTKVATDEHGKSKGFGFVHFSTAEAAQAAIKANTKIGSKEVFVGPFVAKKERMKQKSQTWTNVFVKDIDPTVTVDDLKKLFQEFGEITSIVIMKGSDGASRGFGFVNFAKHENAVKASAQLHKKEFKGKTLWCGPAQKKNERLAELEKNRKQRKETNLYIKNIEDEIDETKLRQYFTKDHFSEVKSVKIMCDERGNSKGFGFIGLSTHEGALNAIKEMHGHPLPGCQKPLYVAFHEPKTIRGEKLKQRFRNRSKQHNSVGVFPPPVFYPPQPFMYSQPNIVRNPRPWPQPYQLPMAGPYHTQVLPGGGRGGRGRGPPQGQSGRGRNPNAPAPQVRRGQPSSNTYAEPELTMETLHKYPADQQRLLLGEKLYPIIYKTQPVFAGKITGMLLDSGWKIEDLLGLLYDEERLNEKVTDAAAILEKLRQESQLHEVPAQN